MFNNLEYILGGVFLIVVMMAVAIFFWIRRSRARRASAAAPVPDASKAPVAARPSPPQSGPFFRLKSLPNLTILALCDLWLIYIAIMLVSIQSQIYIPVWQRVAYTAVAFLVLYLWQTNILRNKIKTLQIGAVTFLEEPVPTGKDGRGLGPGYYGFPLGWPIYVLSFIESSAEFPIEFDQMDVWLLNNKVDIKPDPLNKKRTDVSDAKGAVKGVMSGLAQFRIVDPFAWNAAGKPVQVLKDLTLESARDAAESLMAEGYVAKDNDELGNIIYKDIIEKLNTRNKSLGVESISVTVSLTDIRDPEVAKAWRGVTTSRAEAISRKTANDALVDRIKNLKDNGEVDAQLAISADLATNGVQGVSVTNDRKTFDVGSALKDIGTNITNILAKKFGDKT